MQNIGNFDIIASFVAISVFIVALTALLLMGGKQNIFCELVDLLKTQNIKIEQKTAIYASVILGHIKLIYQKRDQKEVIEFFRIGCDHHSYIYYEGGKVGNCVNAGQSLDLKTNHDLESDALRIRDLVLEKIVLKNISI